MNSAATTRAPWHLWAVGTLGLLWNAFGATDYTMTQLRSRAWYETIGLDAQTTEVMFTFMQSSPAWADAAWACGVWGAVAGCVLLLARKALAMKKRAVLA